MNIVTFLRKNGDLPKRVVEFPLERDTFRKTVVEIGEDFDGQSYHSNGKPWKSSRILRVKPNFFIFFIFLIIFLPFFHFFIFHFSSFFHFSPFFVIFFLFLHFSVFFFFIFLSCSFIFFHFLSFSCIFSLIFFHFVFLLWNPSSVSRILECAQNVFACCPFVVFPSSS